jgi:hypothetical protein
MGGELVQIRAEMEQLEQSALASIKGVRVLSQTMLDATKRIDILEEQMKKRIYVSPVHKNMLQKAVNNHVRVLTEQYGINYKAGSKRIFQSIWRSLKDKYSISVYSELPDIEFENALEHIRHWEDEVLLSHIKATPAA